ncbi:hypothetical protein [Lacimicrobium alkaliphilum]|uniref:Rap1a immunity protein domain-containing protein n=1 Tax=Lacimicrobium alkaliphilum TaxID=1526571 RepID=A0A0U3BCC1_9ALTE|nr:hypothetical protein [Lacimicrobium alkaliphilum]ALS99317.1 hypothetical protein AT746_14325 [Lacimicrobium alkaliphilum]
MLTFKSNNIKIALIAVQSFFLTTVYASEKVTVTDISEVELSAYYEGVAHTLQFGSRLLATMKVMSTPEGRTPAFQALFLAAGTESINRISDLGEDAERAYRKGIVNTTQLWAMDRYPVCLPMNLKLSASDIETAINEVFKGPFQQDSLSILVIGAMEQLSTQHPCK